MKQFLMDEDFANAVLNYLITRPFVEVHEFVVGFQQLKYSDVKEEIKDDIK